MNHPARLSFLLLAGISLAACALGSDTSYVGGVPAPADASILAASMVELVSTQLPAASSTIALDPIPADQANNELTPVFTAALRRRGFAVADDTSVAAPNAHRLRYWVTPLDNGDLVRLSIDNRTEASRFFLRNARGSLQAGGPFMLRQNAEAGR